MRGVKVIDTWWTPLRVLVDGATKTLGKPIDVTIAKFIHFQFIFVQICK